MSQTNVQRPAGPSASCDPSTEVVRGPAAPTPAVHASACLVQIFPTGKGIGTRYPIGTEPVLMGRDQHCHIWIDGEATSRIHASLVHKGRDYYVTDYRSTNGTFVNNTPIFVHKLKDCDYLRIGRHIFRFLAGDNVEALYQEEISRLVVTDALTGIGNRRALTDCLEREVSRANRYGRPLSLVILDIDEFKSVNDRLGHLAGDFVLRELAARLTAEVRKEETLARYGGEEFALVLPESVVADASQVAERLRAVVDASPFDCRGESVRITLSLGVGTIVSEEGLGPSDLIGRADHNLYRAKQEGRNCVVAGPVEQTRPGTYHFRTVDARD